MGTVSRRGLFAATAALSTAAGGTALGAGRADAAPPGAEPPPAPEFTEVSVHDPSVIVTDAGFHVFGSHLSAARSEDLLHWEGVADLVSHENPLFEDVTEELAEAFAWAGSETLWAADVSQTPDGRFRMYYCACEGSSPRSAMGTAIADDVEGPYRDEGIFLRSGMWDEPSEDGEIYDALVHPNAIDPHAFVDADGGYNVRVGRARDVQGPYLDPRGQDLREAKADPDLPLFDDASIEPFGATLVGNHRYADAAEDGPGSGYVSPGHVSAWSSPDEQDTYLFLHSRFPGTDELHQLRVHRIHFTRDGWPVVSPHRYAGELPAGAHGALPHRSALEGAWQVVEHGREISPEVPVSRSVQLHRNGRITGELTGRWRLEGGDRATVTLDGETCSGVFTRGWRESAGAWTTTFTVLGPDGRSLWGTREA